MKTCFSSRLKFLVVVGVTVAIFGCGSGLKAHAQTEPVAEAESDISDNSPVTNAVPLKAAPVAIPENLSPGLAEIIKLAQSNVSEEVLLAYIGNSTFAFNPSAEEILYLTDLGVSDAVITALVNRGKFNVAAANSPRENVATNVYTAPLVPPQIPEAAQVIAPTEPITINHFYETLAPYGNWVEVADYGLCWQPSVVVVNSNWRPYGDRGRWLYTDCGWYWQSDYSWGWAPFHYGRWFNDYRRGWVWAPDNIWGPSWVSWRYSSDYCGWAPLPPAAIFRPGFGFSFFDSNVGLNFEFGLTADLFTFVPTRRFCDRAPYRFAVPRTQSRNIFQNSTVINNYVQGNNNTIINEGIGHRRIASAVGKPIQKVAVRETSLTARGGSARLDRPSRVGNNLVVFRPPTTANFATAPIDSKPTQGGKAFTASPGQNSAGANSFSGNRAKRDSEKIGPILKSRPDSKPDFKRDFKSDPKTGPRQFGKSILTPEGARLLANDSNNKNEINITQNSTRNQTDRSGGLNQEKVKTARPNFSTEKNGTAIEKPRQNRPFPSASDKTENINPQKSPRETRPEQIAELNKFNQHRDISPNPILSQPAPVQPQQKFGSKQNASPKIFGQKNDRSQEKVKTAPPNSSVNKALTQETTENINPQKPPRETRRDRIAELNKLNQQRDISPNPSSSPPAPVQPPTKFEPKQNAAPKIFREKVDRQDLRSSTENSTPKIITKPQPNFTPPQPAQKQIEQPKVEPSLPPVSVPNPQPAIQAPRRMEAQVPPQMKRVEPILPQVQVAPQVHAAPPVQPQIHVAPPAAIQGRPQGQPASGNRSSEGQDKNDRRKP